MKSVIDWFCFKIVLMMPIPVSRRLMYYKLYAWMISRAGCWAYRE